MKIGDLVTYIHEDSESDKATGFYPPVGTIGCIRSLEPDAKLVEVEWESGTMGDGIWYVEMSHIKKVGDETLRELGVYDFANRYRNSLTKENLLKLILKFEFVVQNLPSLFWEEYGGEV